MEIDERKSKVIQWCWTEANSSMEIMQHLIYSKTVEI